MKKKLYNMLAMEENTEGLDTEVTIPEEVIVDEDKETEGAPEADPKEETDEEVDEPIDFPEIGELNVDKVDDQLKEEDEERKEAVEDALEESSQLVAAVEALTEAIRSNGSIGPSMAHFSAMSLEAAKSRLGYANPKANFSMEDFQVSSTDLKAASIVAMEDFRSIVRQIWDNVIKFITKAIEWMRKAFYDFFFGIKKTKEATLALANAVIKQRGHKDGAFAKRRAGAVNDDEHYVSLPANFKQLTIEGVQPDAAGYLDAFTKVLELTKTHKAFPEVFGISMIGKISEMCAGILGGTPINVPPNVINLFDVIPNGSEQVTHAPGKVAPAGMAYFVKDGYMGDYAIANLLVSKTPVALEDGLEALSKWKSEVLEKANDVNDNWLRFLTDEEIKSVTEIVVNIEDELAAYEKTLDKMKHVQEEIKKIGQAAANASGALAPEYFDKNSQEAWRGTAINLVVAAMSNIVNNINESVYQYAKRSHSHCTAWNGYMRAIYVKEKQLLAAV